MGAKMFCIKSIRGGADFEVIHAKPKPKPMPKPGKPKGKPGC